jgi:hypothetical protein
VAGRGHEAGFGTAQAHTFRAQNSIFQPPALVQSFSRCSKREGHSNLEDAKCDAEYSMGTMRMSSPANNIEYIFQILY